MHNKKLMFRGYVVFASALACALIVWGCSSITGESPTGPATGEEGFASGQESSVGGGYSEAFIPRATGGRLVLGRNEVYFPPFSLQQDTLVSIQQVGSRPIFDLHPDMVFDKDVTLTLEYNESGGLMQNLHQLPAIYHYNFVKDRWEFVGGVADRETGTVKVEISHFSRYGTTVPI